MSSITTQFGFRCVSACRDGIDVLDGLGAARARVDGSPRPHGRLRNVSPTETRSKPGLSSSPSRFEWGRMGMRSARETIDMSENADRTVPNG